MIPLVAQVKQFKKWWVSCPWLKCESNKVFCITCHKAKNIPGKFCRRDKAKKIPGKCESAFVEELSTAIQREVHKEAKEIVKQAGRDSLHKALHEAKRKENELSCTACRSRAAVQDSVCCC